MTSKAGSATKGSSSGSFFFFIMLAPVGLGFILLIIFATQYKQFKSVVSPVPEVAEFVWTPAAQSELDTVVSNLHAFTSGEAGHDSLWISAAELKVLLAASRTAHLQGMRFDVSEQDSLILVRSTQPVESMQGQLAWLFKKMAHHNGYLNARLEGTPDLTEGKLLFTPKNGYLNGQRVPSVALAKRGGMSPIDFLEDREFYGQFLGHVKSVALIHGRVLFLRNP